MAMAEEAGLLIVTADQLCDRRQVGAGGFGRIFRALFQPWEMDVAIKILHVSSDRCTENRALLREARLMASLRFPHVVSLVGLYNQPPQPLGIVMEFLEFGSLASVQRRLLLPPALRVRLIHEVALGMNYLHGLDPPLLHLDLNPRNVLLDGELHAKIADFGLSKLKQIASCEISCPVAGTLEYLPPECFESQGDPYKPCPSTDVYSFGIVVWSILTGKHPYGGPNAAFRTLIKVLIPRAQRPDLQDLPWNEGLEKLEVLKELMERCWQNDPRQRPAFSEVVVSTNGAFRVHRAKIPDDVHRVISSLNAQPSQSISDKSFPSRTSPASSGIAQPVVMLHSEGSPRPGPQTLAVNSPPSPAMFPQQNVHRMSLFAVQQVEEEGTESQGTRPSDRESSPSGLPPPEQERELPAPATSRGSQECSEGSRNAGTQRKLPERSGWTAGNITILASRIENMQVGSGNTMHVVRKFPRN